MIKTFCIALCGLALLAESASAAITNLPAQAFSGAIPGATIQRGYVRSRIATTNTGLPNLQSTGITNSVNGVVTNLMFEIPYNAPVSFSLLLGSINRAGIAGTTNYVFTGFFSLSNTGTNDLDFATGNKLLRRYNYPTNGDGRALRYPTNFTAAELWGWRYIRFDSLSNDASLVAGGTTNDLALYPTNASFGAKIENAYQ